MSAEHDFPEGKRDEFHSPNAVFGMGDPQRDVPGPIMTAGEGTFPNYTVRVRLPAIIDRVLESNEYPVEIRGALQSLRDELTGGKPVARLNEETPDRSEWDAEWSRFAGRTWHEVPWYPAEAYFFRRLLEATHYFQSGDWGGVDPYQVQKLNELEGENGALGHFASALSRLPAGRERHLSDLLLFTLWGNRADLSFDSMAETAYAGLDGRHTGGLLIDHREHAWELLQDGVDQVDFVNDNAGLELLFDLALADYLLEDELATRVHFHLKSQPFFVSDTMIADVHATLNRMESQPGLRLLVERLQGYLAQKRLTLTTDPFWVTARGFDRMPAALHDELRASDLVIFKGDANYRRLLDDRDWPHSTSLSKLTTYLQFPFLTIRSLKSPLIVDLTDERVSHSDVAEAGWRVNGQYGIIQFVER